MKRLLATIMIISACDVPTADEVVVAASTECRKAIREELPSLMALAVPVLVSGAREVCTDLNADVELLRDNMADALLLYLGCEPSGEGWDCSTARMRQCQ